MGEVLRREAKDVLAAFLDKWEFENEDMKIGKPQTMPSAADKFGENTDAIVRRTNICGRGRVTNGKQSTPKKMSHEIWKDSCTNYNPRSDHPLRRTYQRSIAFVRWQTKLLNECSPVSISWRNARGRTAASDDYRSTEN